ncbi:MAG: nuclear transport factor 2 family protein [Pseudomonadota bacterium]
MDDDRVREFETGLWLGDAEHYRTTVADDCVMVLPEAPYVLTGTEAIEAVAETPRWSDVSLQDLRISRPEEGLIVLAYTAVTERDSGGGAFRARCSSTYRRLEPDTWRVVQHHQTAVRADET